MRRIESIISRLSERGLLDPDRSVTDLKKELLEILKDGVDGTAVVLALRKQGHLSAEESDELLAMVYKPSEGGRVRSPGVGGRKSHICLSCGKSYEALPASGKCPMCDRPLVEERFVATAGRNTFHDPASQTGREERAVSTQLLFGQLVVRLKLATSEQVQECLQAQAEMAGKGITPCPRLGELLVQRGYLTPKQVEDTVIVSAGTEGLVADHERPSAESPQGESFGKYVKTSKLGEGGMSEVWKGWDKELHRWVAIKTLKENVLAENRHFLREARMVANMVHPNIAAVFEVQENFIAMQYIQGQPLATFPRSDLKILVELMIQVGEAIHYAHEQGIVHLDLKPGNIMVAETERSQTTRRISGASFRSRKIPHAFVMDFGIARRTTTDISLASKEWVMGTPSYMSPEQAKGEPHLDARSDIFSLGATLYQVLTGRHPFWDPTVSTLITKIIEEEPEPLRKINPQIDQDLERIVLKCLKKDLNHRYQTAGELTEDLERWLTGEEVLAHPPSTIYRVRKFVGKRKALFLLILTIQVLLVVTAWFVMTQDAGTGKRSTSDVENLRRLQEMMRPIEVVLRETRRAFYRRDIQIRPQLKKLEDRLEELSRTVSNPSYAPYFEPWSLLGIGLYLLGDEAKAEEALTKAIELRTQDGTAHFCLAKIYLERFMAAHAQDRARGREIPKHAEELRKEARRLMEFPNLTKGLEEVDQHIARLYQALAENNEREALQLSLEGLERYKETAEMGKEEYWRIRGWLARDDQEKIEAYTQALTLRPHDPWVYYMRGVFRGQTGDKNGVAGDYEQALKIAHPRWSYRTSIEAELRRLKP